MSERNPPDKESKMKTTAASSNAATLAKNGADGIAPEPPLWMGSANASDRRKPSSVHLTPRQLEVLALLCEGLPNKLICRRLNISTGTVKAHISSILRELGVGSRLQAVVAARRCGLSGESAGTATPGTDATQSAPSLSASGAREYGKPRGFAMAA